VDALVKAEGGEVKPPQTLFLPGERILFRLCDLSDKARNTINLAFFQFSFPKSNAASPLFKLISALGSASGRGVSVRVMLNGKFSNAPQYAGNHAAAKLLTVLGPCARLYNAKTTLHAKLAIFDDETLVAGSANLTLSSLKSNVEAAVETRDAATVADAVKFFYTLWV
jgi:phosphatidylserine/phosphatidylglycerophosphate/cardiolipin synthase-like enzyme